jgi:hypothetical protein
MNDENEPLLTAAQWRAMDKPLRESNQTVGDLTRTLAQSFARSTREYVDAETAKAVEPLLRRIEDLERALGELRQLRRVA